MGRLDLRAAALDVSFTEAGACTITFDHPDTLDTSDWRVWVQPSGDVDPDDAAIEADVTSGSEQTVAVFSDVTGLEVGRDYRLVVRDDAQTLMLGHAVRSDRGTVSPDTEVSVSLGDAQVEVSVIGGGSGGSFDGGHNDLSGRDAAEAHPISAITGLQAALDGIEVGEGNIGVALMHFTNLDVSQPHPFGAFITEGALVELVGQTNAAQNGTYAAPADAANDPLVKVDDILVAANLAATGRQVVVNRVIQGPHVYGPLEFMVSSDGSGGFQFEPQSGIELFAQAEWDFNLEAAASAPVDFEGAVSAGWLVFVRGATGGVQNDGFYRFVADGSPMVRYPVQPSTGSTVRVMSTGKVYLLTPHSGWLDVTSRLATDAITATEVTYTGTGLLDFAGNAAGGIDGLEGILDRWQFVSAYSTENVDLSTLVVESEVVTQPTLSDGTVPVRSSDVRLFAQTNPAENGAYIVSNDAMDHPGSWVKYEHPTVFDPPGNGYRVTCNAPGTDGHGVTFVYIDDDRLKSRRAGSSDLAEPSASGEWLRLPSPSTDVATAPESAKLDTTDARVPPTPVGATDGHVLTVDDDEYTLAAPSGGGADNEEWAQPLVTERGLGGTQRWGTNLNGPIVVGLTSSVPEGRGSLGLGLVQAGTIATLAINVVTTAAGAGELADICCWDTDDDGLPGDLLWAQAVPVGATGHIRVTGLALSIPATGRYAFGIYNRAGNAGAVAFRAADSSNVIHVATDEGRIGGFFWRQSSPTGPPASFAGWPISNASGVGDLLSQFAVGPQILGIRT